MKALHLEKKGIRLFALAERLPQRKIKINTIWCCNAKRSYN